MRWVPRDVAALGRSGQPLEQPASASWSVTKPSQPPADDCDWRLDLPRLQRRVPRAYANRTRVPRRDRGSDRERSSPQARAGGGWSAWSRKGFTLLPHRLTEVGRSSGDYGCRRRTGSSNHPSDGRASILRRAGLEPVAIISQENSASPSRMRSSRSSFRTKAQRSLQ